LINVRCAAREINKRLKALYMAESSDPVGETSQAGASGSDASPPTHELIKKMLAYKPEPQDVVEVVGYIGPSPKAGTFRLYPRLDLRGYFEIPAGSLIHHAPVDASDISGPSRVLIAGSAKLEIVQVVDARFLRGYIASAHPLAWSNNPSQGGTHGTTKEAPKPPPPTTSEHHQHCYAAPAPPPPPTTSEHHQHCYAAPAPPPQTTHGSHGGMCAQPPPTTSNH
jgi:hypothetical protein